MSNKINKTNKTNKNKSDARPLGVENWRSYACFRAGVRWESRNEDEEARQMFLRSLNYDEKNRGARFNLGTLELSSEPRNYGRALRYLQEARGDANKDAGEGGTIWYKATYQIAATYSYKAYCQDDQNPQYSPAKADEEISRLMKDSQMTRVNRNIFSEEPRASNERRSKARSREEREAEALNEFLTQFAPLALILRASIYVEQEKYVEAERIATFLEPKEDESREILSYRARYNLACYHSRRAGKESPSSPESPFYKVALDHLEYALERDNGLTRWAGKDPALAKLREHHSAKFDELVERYPAPTRSKAKDSLPLADLAAIGETYAALLKEHGVSSRDDLIRKADTPEARRTLAEELGIDISLVKRWAFLADLLRLVDIDAQAVNLLEAVGVGSLRDLRVCDPERLYRLLSQENRARSLVEQPPSVEVVCRWVRDAGSTTLPIVSGE